MNARSLKTYRIESKERVQELRYYCLQYNQWKTKILDTILEGSSEQDGMPRGGGISNPVATAAINIEQYANKVANVEKAARLCCSDKGLQEAVLYAVTHKKASYNILYARGKVNYGRDAFYIARYRFFYELDKLIN